MRRIVKSIRRRWPAVSLPALALLIGLSVPGTHSQASGNAAGEPSNALQPSTPSAVDLLSDGLGALDKLSNASAKAGAIEPGDRLRTATILDGELGFTLEADQFFKAGAFSLTLRFDEAIFHGLRIDRDRVKADHISFPGTLDLTVRFTPAEQETAPHAMPMLIDVTYEDILVENFEAPVQVNDLLAASSPSQLIRSGFRMLRQVEAARIFTALATTSVKSHEGQSASTVYEDITIIGLQDGQISEQSVDRTRLINELPTTTHSGDKLEAVLGRNVVRGFDIVPLEALLTGQTASDRTVLLDSQEISGIGLSSPGSSGTIERIAIENVQVQASTSPLADLMDREAAGQEVSEADMAQAVLTTLGAFSLGRFEIDTLAVQSDTGNIGIRSIALREMSGQGIGGLTVNDLEIDSQDMGRAALGHFGLHQFKFPPLAGIFDADGMPSHLDAFSLMPTFGKIVFSALEVEPVLPNGTGPDGVDRKEPLHLALVEHVQRGFISQIATDMTFLADGLEIPASYFDDTPLAATLKQLGIPAIEFNQALALRWDSQTQTLFLEDLAVEAVELGSARLSLRLGNVPRSVFTNPALAQIAIINATVEGGHLRLTGEDLLSTLLSKEAENNQLGKAELIDGLIDVLDDELGALADTDFGRDLTASVKRFLETMEELTFELAPGTPVSLAELAGLYATDPAALPEVLGARVSTPQ